MRTPLRHARSPANDGLHGSPFAFKGSLPTAITDFSVPLNAIGLARTVFAVKADAGGHMLAAQCQNITNPKVKLDGDDRVLYDRTTGDLFCTASELDKTAAVKFAHLDHNPALGPGDFLVV